MKCKSFFEKLFLALIFVMLILSVLNLKVVRDQINWMVIVLFCVIFIISMIGVLADKKKFSINKVFWYFNIFFLFLAPLIQYITNYFPWKYEISDSMYIEANVLIILCFLVYIIAYNISIKKVGNKKGGKIEYDDNTVFYNERGYSIVYLFIIAVLCFLILVSNIGFSGMFVRSTNYTDIVSDTAMNSVITTFCRSFPVHLFTYMFYIKNKLNKKVNRILYITTFILLVISNFPTSVTRFWMGAIYIGILLLYKRQKMTKRIFDIAFCTIFIIIFPVFASFKQISITNFNINDIDRLGITQAYDSTDYDAYTIIPRMLKYNKSSGITYGKQILGTIFFFIPRSIWKTKPIASGAELAIAQNQWYTNISCPYIAEGLINFGVIGAVAFTIVLAKIIKYCDDRYWYYQEKNDNKIHYIEMYYVYMIGFIIFLLRGALHHAIIYISGFLLPLMCIIFMERVLQRRRKKLNERVNE